MQTTKTEHQILAFALSLLLALSCLLPGTGMVAKANAKSFTPRLNAPYGISYYTTLNPFYNTGYGMPNCTCYAWGRAYEILGSRPNLCEHGASQWWGYNNSTGAYPSGRTPALGAIACWGRHVAVVEKIEGDKVTISESHASGRYFDTYTLTKGKESSYAGTFYGYIYILRNGSSASNWSNVFSSGSGSSSSTPRPSNYAKGYYTVDTGSKSSNLNIRSGPGKGYSKLGYIPNGTRIYITSVDGNWGKTTYGGVTGWVMLEYTRK